MTPTPLYMGGEAAVIQYDTPTYRRREAGLKFCWGVHQPGMRRTRALVREIPSESIEIEVYGPVLEITAYKLI